MAESDTNDALDGSGSTTRVVAAASGATWAKRPPGVPAVVPSPSLPLTFFAVSAAGLVACGIALALVAATVVSSPMAGPVIAAAQFGTLAVLSMGVLGALHQFVPVVAQRPLRSLRLAWSTLLFWFLGAWLVPIGLAARAESVVAIGGASISVAVGLALYNFASPLAAKHKGAPIVGLRFAFVGLVVTAGSGAAFIADRSGAWFDLAGHVVVAHALLGLFLWLGLVYIAVAEKLWPMFLLSHIPGRHRSGALAVWATPSGASILATGVWTGLSVLGWLGGVVLSVGLGSHLASMVAHVRHRRRGADLHLAFLLGASLWLVVGVAVACVAALVPVAAVARERLVGAAIAALAGWLLTALVGHAHKVVPFISWTSLRAAGVEKNVVTGRPLLFADLYDLRLARATFALLGLGIAGVGGGLLLDIAALVALGGCALAVTAILAAVNLSLRTLRRLAPTWTSRTTEKATALCPSTARLLAVSAGRLVRAARTEVTPDVPPSNTEARGPRRSNDAALASIAARLVGRLSPAPGHKGAYRP